MSYELAQVNIAVLRAPLDSAMIADFVANLAPLNARAEAAAGGGWSAMATTLRR